jgi:hypothetical protein
MKTEIIYQHEVCEHGKILVPTGWYYHYYIHILPPQTVEISGPFPTAEAAREAALTAHADVQKNDYAL